MRTLKSLFTLFVFSILVYSCSSDDNNGGGELANQQNQLEDVPVPLSNLNSDISIEGATKNQGTPPAPNSTINLELSSDQAEAYQNAGFNVRFSTTETNIAGAYLLFKDSDDNTASEYFDIPVSSFETGKSNNTKNTPSSKGSSLFKSNSLVDGEYEIDVDFGSDFPPGKFCGDLCIYDSENNISQIVTICVEVEAWGGNADIIGEWILESSTEDDDKYTVDCNNDQSIEADYYKVIKEDLALSISSNGDFSVTENTEEKVLDIEASKVDCSAVYSDEIEKDESKETGKWAYNETDKTLTLVSFKYEDFINSEYNEEYPNGDLILESGKVQIVDGKLVVTDTYTENGTTYTDTYTFVRK
ncbi:hypothetical protein [Flavivirga eckloniae]|uniref:Lipocalin-like domain-containing protein n=1 Tax=Flavivirga eckloniae TaxID=1803846 RepID=A0A2K9PVD5_9FLAO|nr:hypothetical protein [Flavivirga eckloniae]AUP81019.1 hypothetical protein C1H87_20795 [Flavivirga eckloniae]